MALWVSSGRVSNPTSGQIIADTGALSAGTRQLVVAGACSVAVVMELQHRNAANDTTLKSQILAVPASGFQSLQVPHGLDVGDGERFRVEVVVGVTGNVSASIFY